MREAMHMIEYRKASENDVSRLAELRVKQLIDEGYRPTSDITDHLKTYYASSIADGSLICWVGTDEAAVVATGALCFYQLPPSFSNPTGRIAYLTNMYTDDAFRRRGIASHLVSLLLKEAEKLAYTSVRLHASDDGRSIYVNAGFVATDGYMAKKL